MPPSIIVRYAQWPSKEEASLSSSIAPQMLLVFLAGGAGATLRVLLSVAVERGFGERLPNVGVLSANMLGCLLIGFCAVSFPAGPWRTIVLGGLLGGFTTYSAFALFTVELAQADRYSVVAIQLGIHLVGGILCVLAGLWLARAVGVGS